MLGPGSEILVHLLIRCREVVRAALQGGNHLRGRCVKKRAKRRRHIERVPDDVDGPLRHLEGYRRKTVDLRQGAMGLHESGVGRLVGDPPVHLGPQVVDFQIVEFGYRPRGYALEKLARRLVEAKAQ